MALVLPELIEPYREFLEYSDMGPMLGVVRQEAAAAPAKTPPNPVRRAARTVRSALRR